jgi:hypothetical protein
MSETYVPTDVRRLVVGRAESLCEYCLIAESDTYFGCQIDHVVSEKHGGPTTADNLAFACLFCNVAKGSDVGSLDWETGELVRFFNPRIDLWWNHFELSGDRIDPLTAVGRVTVRILGFNSPDRCRERSALLAAGRYPTPAATARMTPKPKP